MKVFESVTRPSTFANMEDWLRTLPRFKPWSYGQQIVVLRRFERSVAVCRRQGPKSRWEPLVHIEDPEIPVALTQQHVHGKKKRWWSATLWFFQGINPMRQEHIDILIIDDHCTIRQSLCWNTYLQ